MSYIFVCNYQTRLVSVYIITVHCKFDNVSSLVSINYKAGTFSVGVPCHLESVVKRATQPEFQSHFLFCVILGKLLNFFKSWFPHPSNGDDKIAS